MPATSPIAQTPSAARRRSSTVIPRRVTSTPSATQAEAVDVRAPARCDEQAGCFDRVTDRGRHARRRRGGRPRRRAVRSGSRSPRPEALLQQLAGLRIELRGEPVVHLHNRHARPHAPEELRKLGADGPASARRGSPGLRRPRPRRDSSSTARLRGHRSTGRQGTTRSRSTSSSYSSSRSPASTTPSRTTRASPRTSFASCSASQPT